jgi:hypothetical protein
LALPEMRLLFRGHFACGHQVDKKYYEKDRKFHDTKRRLSVAVGLIVQFGGSRTKPFCLTRRYAACLDFRDLARLLASVNCWPISPLVLSRHSSQKAGGRQCRRTVTRRITVTRVVILV